MSITTTAAQVAAAVNAKCPDLVVVTNFAGNDGTGIVTAMPVVALAGGDANTAASISMDPVGANNKLTFTAVAKGADGNRIKVLYVDPGDGSPLDVLILDGRTIYIILGDAPAGPAGRASGYSELAADSSNIANAWTDTGLTVTITLPSGTSGKVLLLATIHTGGGNGNELVALRFVVDGVAQKPVGSNRYGNSVQVTEALSMIASGLASGDHTFKVQAINSENVNFHIVATSYQSNLSAIEL